MCCFISCDGPNNNLLFRYIGPVKKTNWAKIIIIFFSISLNMCFGCSKKTSHWVLGPDKMPSNGTLHCFLSQDQSSEKEKQYLNGNYNLCSLEKQYYYGNYNLCSLEKQYYYGNYNLCSPEKQYYYGNYNLCSLEKQYYYGNYNLYPLEKQYFLLKLHV